MSLDIRTPDQEGIIGLLFQYPNQIAGGILGVLFLVAVFTISFSAAFRGTGEVMKAYLAAGFLTMGTSIFLLAFGILPSSAFIAAVIAYLLGLALIDR